MSATSAAAAGQRAAATLMTDACVIAQPGALVWNPATQTETATDVTVYTGVCRIRPQGWTSTGTRESGEGPLAQWPFIVTVPLSVVGITLGDVLTVTDSADADLIGCRLKVHSVAQGTTITARRLGCERESR